MPAANFCVCIFISWWLCCQGALKESRAEITSNPPFCDNVAQVKKARGLSPLWLCLRLGRLGPLTGIWDIGLSLSVSVLVVGRGETNTWAIGNCSPSLKEDLETELIFLVGSGQTATILSHLCLLSKCFV